MIFKEGDWVKVTLIGGDYRVKWIGERMVVLETKDGSGQFLTTIDNLDSNLLLQNPKIKKKIVIEERN